MHKWCGFQGIVWDKGARLFPFCLTDDTNTYMNDNPRLVYPWSNRKIECIGPCCTYYWGNFNETKQYVQYSFAPKLRWKHSEVPKGSIDSAIFYFKLCMETLLDWTWRLSCVCICVHSCACVFTCVCLYSSKHWSVHKFLSVHVVCILNVIVVCER